MRSSGHFVKVCSTHIMPSLALPRISSLASHNWTQCWKKYSYYLCPLIIIGIAQLNSMLKKSFLKKKKILEH